MSSEVDTLCEMGFPKNRAEKALAKTSYSGVQAAMDWLFSHADDADIDDPYEAAKGHVLGEQKTSVDADAETPAEEGPEAGGASAVAMSLKCDDCGKMLRSEMDAQTHAARSGHSNFSESTDEIKPLSVGEKAAQMDSLKEKIKQRNEEKVMAEKQDQVSREKMRRAAGKEMVASKAKLEEKEMRKLIDQRRREKEDDKLARQKVKDQIERDKRDRALKFAVKSSSHGGDGGGVGAASASIPAATVAPLAVVPPKEYDQSRIQVRLTNGQALTHSFGAKEELAAVRLYIEMNRTDGVGAFSLMTSFPRKVFTPADMEKPLDLLGLVPSAVLIVTKAAV